MLQVLISEVCAELGIEPVPKMNEKNFVSFHLGNIEVEIRDFKPGFSFFSKITPCSEKKREELFLTLMKANYLGQQTGKQRIGLSFDEKFLTLSLSLPYEVNYRTFRECLEDFINFVLYWRENIEKLANQEPLL